MQANQKQFLRFLEGADTHFVIPVYQRNYDWTKEQCEQLFNDLIDISENNFRTHFIGSIVSIYNNDQGGREYLIIDGQQRITTLSILLQAIYKVLDEEVLESEDDRLKEKIEDYLVNRHVENDKRIRLKPIKDDAEAFSKLFGNKNNFVDASNITINFWYFYKRILDEKISVDDLFLAIKNLIIVEIELRNGEDDPQLIFESLNSTGLDLSEADKVRNFILMKEDTEKQNYFYEEYWNKIEKNTNFDVSNFIRDYLTLKERITPKKSRVYLSFKKFVLEQKINIENLLKDLSKFSEYYKKIIGAKSDRPENEASSIIYRLNKLETVVSYPFLLEILNDNNNGTITDDELVNILKIIESFVLRRFICDVPTNALNKIFMTLGKEIKKHEDYEQKYFEIFKYILIKKDSNQRFPDNKEFQDKIVSKDIYNVQSKNKIYLLEQLENYNNREKVRVEELVNNNKLTIEHVMPQTLTPDWKKELGENWMKIYEKYLNTLGNITLTAYNSEYSNKSFIEKKDMDKGFRESRLFLNKYLSIIEEWNEKNIRDRAEKLRDRALEIWEYPSTEYKPKKDMDKIFALADNEIAFTGKVIVSFSYGEYEDYKVRTWKEFYELIVKELYGTNPNIFISSLKNTSIENRTSNDKDDFYLPIKLSEKLYLKADMSTESLLFTLRKIIEKFDVNPAEITFTIK